MRDEVTHPPEQKAGSFTTCYESTDPPSSGLPRCDTPTESTAPTQMRRGTWGQGEPTQTCQGSWRLLLCEQASPSFLTQESRDFCKSDQMGSQNVPSTKDFGQTPAQIHAPYSALTESCLWLPRQPWGWLSGGLVYPSENGLGVESRTGPGNGLGPFGWGSEGSGVLEPGPQG